MNSLVKWVGLMTAMGLVMATPIQAQTSAIPSVESRNPEGKGQVPAFTLQTRVPRDNLGVKFRIRVLAGDLDHPWSVAALPQGGYLITEKSGRLRHLSAGGRLSGPITGLPAVFPEGQAGLLDLVPDPGFAANQVIWWTFIEKRSDGVGVTVGTGRLVLSGNPGASVLDVRIFYRTKPSLPPGNNYGSRLAFAPDGRLFLSVGDRFQFRDQAQEPNSDIGKVLLLKPGEPRVWSRGHRNIQGLAFDSAGLLWSVEHGARGGDELNHPEDGKNYGWPVISYGIEYSGAKIGDGVTARDGMEQPVYYWDPVIAPSGFLVYTGDRFENWKDSFFIGGLRGQHLARLTVKNGIVTGEERLLADSAERIRDVRQDLDGALLILTDAAKGRLIRLE